MLEKGSGRGRHNKLIVRETDFVDKLCQYDIPFTLSIKLTLSIRFTVPMNCDNIIQFTGESRIACM